MRLRASGALLAIVAAGACRSSEPPQRAARESGSPAAGGVTSAAPPRGDHARELAALRAFEESRRSWQEIARRPPAEVALGPNPYRLAALPGGGAVGLLRGAAAIAVLEPDGRERERIEAPPSPTAVAVDGRGLVWVGGTGSPEIAIYRQEGDGLVRAGEVTLDGAWTARALVAGGERWMYAADERSGRVVALAVTRARSGAVSAVRQREVGRCGAPIALARTRRHLVASCLFDHALLAWPLGDGGRPTGEAPVRIAHDGPLWSVDAVGAPDGDVLVAGGVEDHPLEREDGGFGYIDSFLYAYRIDGDGARRLAAVNVSAHGVVTPKWLRAEIDGDTLRVVTAGYATALVAEVAIPLGGESAPRVATRAFWPGTTDWLPGAGGAAALAASPLLDDWLVDAGGPDAPARVAAPDTSGIARTVESRIGEALLFTSLMAPWGSSEGRRSRFTCETCHFEAHGDGRVHYTGRGEVHASTRPLRGLVENRPHFSRALDRTTTKMVHAEFRVANRWNGRDPWFAVDAGDVPWLTAIEGAPRHLSPELLRRSLIAFLADFGFETNQAVRGRQRFTRLERAGAERFRERCAGCHRARVVTDDPASEVPFDRWEELIFAPAGPLVWASPEYQKTGVEPYVHERGARTPSLRRLHLKHPYFTSGSAASLDEVLARAGWVGDRFFHDGAPAGAVHLDAGERRALRAFLELL